MNDATRHCNHVAYRLHIRLTIFIYEINQACELTYIYFKGFPVH